MAKKTTETTTTPKPWERQERETPKSFAAFCVYRDMGPQERTLPKTAKAVGKSLSMMDTWSQKYGWVDRAAAWDDEQDRLKREADQKAQIEAIKKMRKRHTEVAVKMIDKAEAAIDEILAGEIKPADIPRSVDIATKLERISRGDAGEVIEERHGEAVAPAVQFYVPSNGRDNIGEEDDE